jgi:two-component sensor histidine kinase
VREEAIPVVCGDEVIAVVARHGGFASARTPSRLELSYLQCADDLAWMITEGRFPFPGTMLGRRGAPRVGDGLVRLNAAGVVAYASPNAVSAYRRLGLDGDLVGRHFGDTTAQLALRGEAVDEPIAMVTTGRAPRRVDVEGRDAVLALRSLPLERGPDRVGALILIRDVTELRRRERELLSKDATIREIHHRVKNNLQTVAALLRLQARRVGSPEARTALEEAMRRVAAIAMVHETLSRQLDGTVDLGEIAEQVVSASVEVAAGALPVQVRREGTWGEVPGEVATPVAMAVSELVHNAVEHGLVPDGGNVVVTAARSHDHLTVRVADDGRGLPAGFDPDSGASLGLQIVRTLIEGELGGRLSVAPGHPRGTVATIEVPVPPS